MIITGLLACLCVVCCAICAMLAAHYHQPTNTEKK